MIMQAKETIKKMIEANLKGGEKSLLVKVKPEDSIAHISITDDIEDSVERIYKRIPEKYRDHVIGFKKCYYKDGSFCNFGLIFAEEYQKMFDAEMDAYYHDKASWIARFGSN